MNKYLAAVGAAAVSLAIGGSANAATLVNGFFEQPGGVYVRDVLTTGYLPGWTYDGGGAFDIYESSGADAIATVDGGHYVSFGHNSTSGGSLSQTFATTAGTTYDLSYLVGQQQGVDLSQLLRATIVNGAQTLTADSTPLALGFGSGAGLSFTATGAFATLTFTDLSTGGGYANLALDNVSIDAKAPTSGGGSAVPEPATWAMMIVGFGLVGSMSRRRRTWLATA